MRVICCGAALELAALFRQPLCSEEREWNFTLRERKVCRADHGVDTSQMCLRGFDTVERFQKSDLRSGVVDEPLSGPLAGDWNSCRSESKPAPGNSAAPLSEVPACSTLASRTASEILFVNVRKASEPECMRTDEFACRHDGSVCRTHC